MILAIVPSRKMSSCPGSSIVDFFCEGTIAKIIQILKLPNGLLKILVDGIIQGRIINFTENDSFFEAEIDMILPQPEDPREMNALTRQMSNLFKEYVKINKTIPEIPNGMLVGKPCPRTGDGSSLRYMITCAKVFPTLKITV